MPCGVASSALCLLLFVQGAEEMAQVEHLMNVYASKAAKGSVY
jgi:hypothetical protein